MLSSTEELENETAWLCLGAQHALDAVYVLIANWRIKRYAENPHPASDLLIRVMDSKIKPNAKNRDAFIKQMLMLVETVIESLLQNGDYEMNPTGGPAVAGRILASMRAAFDRLDDREPSPDIA